MKVLIAANTHPIWRWLLSASIMLTPAIASAQIEQFNTAQCAQLETALEQNREQQRRGYKLKQEVKIKTAQAKLELQLEQHCQRPVQVQPRAQRHKAQTDKDPTHDQHRSSIQVRNAAPNTHAKRSRPRAAQRSTASQSTTAQSTAALPTLSISRVEVKAPYQGAKLMAWLQFYQTPFYCFGVRQTERIRQCVEQRQQAQLRFERSYQPHSQTISPVPQLSNPTTSNNLSDQSQSGYAVD